MSLSSRAASSAAFGHLSRLFMAMKRHGRIIDVLWFQHSPDYARAVVAAAAATDDPAIHEILLSVRSCFASHLAPATVTPLAAARPPAPAAATPAPPPAPTVDPRRYVGRLR